MKSRRLSWVLAALALAIAPRMCTAQPNAKGVEFFETKIRPVLAKHCYECHSAKATKVRGSLFLDTKAGLLEGGDSGEAAIVPGKPEQSLLIQALRHQEIKMPPPPKGRLSDAVINDFVQWIAMGAPDPRAGAAAKAYKTMTLEDAKTFWAFQAPKKAAPPTLNDAGWPKSMIDRFVLAKIEQKGLKPVADAERRTLLRRLYMDLIGLPPTPEQIEAFINDASAQAVEKVVDSLLASPHYGERWGRHWLDVARYAESNGNADNTTFPFAFRYRNYVIKAFNDDKPYDRFIMEQVAGDLLPAEDAKLKDEHLVATGFLALTSKPRAQNNPDYKYDLIADQIDVTSRAVLGLSVMCSRCHDHKFDAIPTKDYYALAGIFDSSVMLFGGAVKGAKGASGTHILSDGAGAMGLKEGRPGDINICVRGEARQLGPKVERGFLTALKNDKTPPVNRDQSGRLELARWLTQPENPLTARVAVNRVWQHLFGQGIVPTSDNFGALGEPPTNPELLDYLAVRFLEEKWSTKKLIKEIVLSRTYQLSSTYNAANHKLDPETTYLWRMPVRRLEAEAIRDSILAISGQLDTKPPPGSMLGTINPKGKKTGAGRDSNHRSVYLAMVRGAPLPEILALFDLANPNLVVSQREVTTVPAQALFLMNSPFVTQQATYFARRVLEPKDLDDNARIDLAYAMAFGRPATDLEKQQARAYLAEALAAVGATDQLPAWASFCQTLYATAEFRYVQ
jgi:hypothetical protein